MQKLREIGFFAKQFTNYVDCVTIVES